MLDLEDSLEKRAAGLTADGKQKISLGRGLVRSDVNVIMFDEPLTVIDPHVKWQLRSKLKELHQRIHDVAPAVAAQMPGPPRNASMCEVLDHSFHVKFPGSRHVWSSERTPLTSPPPSCRLRAVVRMKGASRGILSSDRSQAHRGSARR